MNNDDRLEMLLDRMGKLSEHEEMELERLLNVEAKKHNIRLGEIGYE